MSATSEQLPSPASAEVVEHTNVQDLHAPLNRELNEPHDGFEPVPFWMIVFFGFLMLWGGFYMSAYSGDFRVDMLDSNKTTSEMLADQAKANDKSKPVDPIAVGKKLFGRCASCHQATGLGDGVNIPPLAGSEWVIGTQPEEIARLSRILLHGLAGPVTVKGKLYPGGANVMPAWGGELKDEQIAAVLTYIRQEWGNKAPPIDASTIAAARAATAGRTGPWNEQLLLAITAGDPGAAPAAGAPPAGALPAAPMAPAKK
jgi:mono/diheme cytochrome c family protein